MPAALARFRTFYGAHPLHLLAVLASFALLGYIISVAGPATFWNPAVWWQSILVWFLGAALLHDLVLFPLCALGDRLHTAGVHTLRRRRGHHPDRPPHVSAINYVRIPVLASGLLLLVFLPGIIEQGAPTYLAATGQTQAPFLDRWLLFTAIAFALSAVAYAVHYTLVQRKAGQLSAGTADADAGTADCGARNAVAQEPRA